MGLLAATLLVLSAPLAPQEPSPQPVPEPAVAPSESSSDQSERWAQAVADAPQELREDFAFLVEHLPARDRSGLEPADLLQEVALARKARESVSWGDSIPDSIWRNAVLPHCHVSEVRESMRAELQERYLERAAACATPGEAALMLNATLFGELGVKYSTARERPDQSSKQTVASGLASCTGLSILLADACRAVGVPARLAGIANWVNKKGNHTWVEVWDGADWRFLGAAEPDAKGLDHTWFLGDAALAQPGSLRHGIWAVQYAPTDQRFPLVWQAGQDYVHAVDVTERYRSAANVSGVRLDIVVRNAAGQRVEAPLRLEAQGTPVRRMEDRSRGEGADTNDIASFQLDPQRTWMVRAGDPPFVVHATVESGAEDSSLETLELVVGPDGDDLAGWMVSDPGAARAALWAEYAAQPKALALAADYAGSVVRTADRTSAYVAREVGDKPAGGWPLVIAMHGGGGTTKEFNDSQWRHMQVYYRDHPEVSGYRYLALRAPNDEWNGFYDDSIAPLIRRLVLAQILFGDVDPDAVHAIGYSHGGYGAFVIGPKVPDLFASVHASASAPTGGETKFANFANLAFSTMVGEHDTAYGRVKRCREFDDTMAQLRGAAKWGADERPYPTLVQVIADKGHGGLPDRDLLTVQLPKRRALLPKHVIWEPSGPEVGEQYWVSIAKPADGQRVEAHVDGQSIEVLSTDVEGLSLWLDERLVDLDKALTVIHNGEAQELRVARNLAVARESLERWGDPRRIYFARVDL